MKANSMRELWLSRSRTIANAWVDQEELLVAKNKRQYEEIHSRIYKIPTEQSTTHEDRRTSSNRDTLKTIVGN